MPNKQEKQEAQRAVRAPLTCLSTPANRAVKLCVSRLVGVEQAVGRWVAETLEVSFGTSTNR